MCKNTTYQGSPEGFSVRATLGQASDQALTEGLVRVGGRPNIDRGTERPRDQAPTKRASERASPERREKERPIVHRGTDEIPSPKQASDQAQTERVRARASTDLPVDRALSERRGDQATEPRLSVRGFTHRSGESTTERPRFDGGGESGRAFEYY